MLYYLDADLTDLPLYWTQQKVYNITIEIGV